MSNFREFDYREINFKTIGGARDVSRSALLALPCRPEFEHVYQVTCVHVEL